MKDIKELLINEMENDTAAAVEGALASGHPDDVESAEEFKKNLEKAKEKIKNMDYAEIALRLYKYIDDGRFYAVEVFGKD